MKSWSYMARPDELGRLPPERSRNFLTKVCTRGIGRSFHAYVVVYQPSTASPPSAMRAGVAVATPPWIGPLEPGLRASLAISAASREPEPREGRSGCWGGAGGVGVIIGLLKLADRGNMTSAFELEIAPGIMSTRSVWARGRVSVRASFGSPRS